MWFLCFLNVLCLIFFFFCLFEAVSFLSFWFVLELLSFSLIPYFVFDWLNLSRRGLLQYVVVLLFSSLFLVLGLLLVGYRELFFCLGILMKLGVFPFFPWLYEMVVYSNWSVVWLVSSVLKIPFFLLFYVQGLSINYFVSFLCVFSFFVLSINFWKFSFGWRYCWCHMMLSGSAAMAVVSLSNSLSLIFLVFGVYVIWCTMVLLFFSDLEVSGLSGPFVLIFIFVLVSFPFTVSVLYKLALGVSIFFSSFLVFVVWCIYSISEQLFLLFYLVSSVRVRSFVSLTVFV